MSGVPQISWLTRWKNACTKFEKNYGLFFVARFSVDDFSSLACRSCSARARVSGNAHNLTNRSDEAFFADIVNSAIAISHTESCNIRLFMASAGLAELLDVNCAECEAPMKLRASKHGLFWGCTFYPECKGTHGAHSDGRPLGKPANAETKLARRRAHRAFDQLWVAKDATMTRSQAYVWLARRLGMDVRDCHIGKFDAATCERVILEVSEKL